MKTDALARRLRFAPPNPKHRPRDAPERLCPTDADCLVFEAIDRHGPLPTHYLFEFQKHLRPSYHHFQYRLRDLFHGDAGGSYLMRPSSQFAAYEARYQHLVYDLTPRARRLLAARSTHSPYSARRYDPFVHQLMTACITASFELTAPRHGLRFIGRDEILGRRSCPKSIGPNSNPLTINMGPLRLTPDALFGMEYPGIGFRFFGLEVDRNTESICSSRLAATTFAKKISGYDAILAGRLYSSSWGLPNLSILTVTTNSKHAALLLDQIFLRSVKYRERFYFQYCPYFGKNWRVPKGVIADVLDGQWISVSGAKHIAAVHHLEHKEGPV